MKKSDPIQKNIERFPTRRGRLLVVGGIKWRYSVSKQGTVLAYSELGDRRQAHASELKGFEPDTFSRGQWKKTSDGMLLPVEVARWLSKESNKTESIIGSGLNPSPSLDGVYKMTESNKCPIKKLVLCQEHKAYVSKLYSSIRENFIKDKRLMPVAFVRTIRDQMLIIGMPFDNLEQKEMCFEMLRDVAEKEQADTVVTAIESWALTAASLDKIPQGSLECHPEREEVILVMLHIRAMKGEAWGVMVPITRDGDNVYLPEKMPELENHKVEGRAMVFPGEQR